jgi:tetratricopeptide (TPR) repeat protein
VAPSILPFGRTLLVIGTALVASGVFLAPELANGETPQSATATKAPARAADPYLVKLREGDAAYLARDYATAAAIYSDAIKAKSQDATGHLRLGEALRAQSKFDAALEAFENASRFAATLADRQRAKFMVADTHERAAKWAQAKAQWTDYEAAAADHAQRVAAKAAGVSAEDPVYPESARERRKQVDAVVERTEQYATVKARIEKREAEISAKAKADAAKQK